MGEVIIREATVNDIEDIDAMAPVFFEYAQLDKKGLSYDSFTFRQLLASFIKEDYGIVLVAELKESATQTVDKLIGSIAGVISPWMMDHRQKVLMETWWWVFPEYWSLWAGLDLVMAFEEAARKKEVDLLIMVTLDGPKEETLKTYYRHFDMKHLEHHYIKRL